MRFYYKEDFEDRKCFATEIQSQAKILYNNTIAQSMQQIGSVSKDSSKAELLALDFREKLSTVSPNSIEFRLDNCIRNSFTIVEFVQNIKKDPILWGVTQEDLKGLLLLRSALTRKGFFALMETM